MTTYLESFTRTTRIKKPLLPKQRLKIPTSIAVNSLYHSTLNLLRETYKESMS